MTYLLISITCLLSSCASMPSLFNSVEEIADDDAVSVMISREAIQQDKNVRIVVQVE